MKNSDRTQVTFSDSPTEEEVKLIEKGLEDYNREQTNGKLDDPGIEINLVLKDDEGNVVGGLGVSTVLRVMHLEVFWVAKEYRKLGYGRELVLEAERIGREKGCILSHTWTFSFQAPEFYEKIGYELVAIYDGYPDGITEHIFRKRLQRHDQSPVESKRMRGDGDSGRFSITENATKEEMRIVGAGLNKHVKEQIGKERLGSGVEIRLVVKDQEKVVGGLLAWMPLMNMTIEHIWLDEGYRGLGYGSKLMLEAEKIAQEHGCIACLTYSFSFQAPGFFQKLGYETFGIDDGYPDPIEEHYLIKKFE